ncbi:MAG: glycoside hydrolase family 88 protein [Candidatus Lernaella stagnicola]|nr:glycoside hydrolase family 88 protein [Candidatus Lernaella stagnicola]
MKLWKLFLVLLLAALLFAAAACGDDDDDDHDDDETDDDTAGDDDASPSELVALAQALADTWIDSYEPETMGWSWDSGVVMLGMWDLYELTGETTYRQYVKDWLDYHIAAGYTIAYNDHVPPARLAVRLFEQTGGAEYRAAVDATKAYVFEQADRLPDGALVHMGWTTPQQIWVDSLFMATPFLEEAGALDNDADCFAEAELQFRVFAEHLQDPDAGMYRHRYDANDESVTPVEADFWGRGNAWVIAASGTAARLLPEDLAGRAAVVQRFVTQAEAMAALQDENGRWHTIMNRPDTYLETSVGPLFAYGVYQAATVETIDEDLLVAADNALLGALDQVVADEHGNALLLGTSYGTGPGTWELYEEVLKGEQVNYGIGATILAVCAREKLERAAALPPPGMTDETYIPEPEGDDPVAWGYFYMARGDFRSALTSLEAAVDESTIDPDAQSGVMLIEAIRLGMAVLAGIDEWYVEQIDMTELIASLLTQARDTGGTLVERSEGVVVNEDFSRVVERLVLTEQGGSTGIGTVEIDLGEAYLLQAVGHLLVGAADVAEGFGLIETTAALGERNPILRFLDRLPLLPKADLALVGQGLDSLVAAIDSLVVAIETIDAETDDQSDDLVPKNIVHLEGDFSLPGIMLPTPLEELLGFDPREFFGDDPLPQALIDVLYKVRNVLSMIRMFLP